MNFLFGKKWRQTAALYFFILSLIYLYIEVRKAVRKKITIFGQLDANQMVIDAKSSAKSGARFETETNNALRA
ncbi:MAG: hypothetical protein PHC95_06825 [Parabacteroides sp.]|nr:hypothetical protein [Parabacteroides sp.]